jgi:hypothetical protein
MEMQHQSIQNDRSYDFRHFYKKINQDNVETMQRFEERERVKEEKRRSQYEDI